MSPRFMASETGRTELPLPVMMRKVQGGACLPDTKWRWGAQPGNHCLPVARPLPQPRPDSEDVEHQRHRVARPPRCPRRLHSASPPWSQAWSWLGFVDGALPVIPAVDWQRHEGHWERPTWARASYTALQEPRCGGPEEPCSGQGTLGFHHSCPECLGPATLGLRPHP